jgi:hypothetical protein
MMTIEIFTALPEGRTVPDEGTVVKCPRCGRNGILQEQGLCGPRCLHAETTTVLGDGMLIEPTDCCTLPPLR